MAISYYRLWKGKDILETDYESKDRELDFSFIFDDIFKERSISYNRVFTRSSHQFLQVKYNNKTYNLFIYPIKNSGLSDVLKRKRMQVYPEHTEISNPIYVLGTYNAGDKRIYVSADITDFWRNAQNGRSYSSLWLDYSILENCYFDDFYSCKDNKRRYISSITNVFARTLSDAELIEYLFPSNEEHIVETIKIEGTNDEIKLYDNSIYQKNGVLMPRDPRLKTLAFIRENYTCELCGTQDTFLNGITNKQHFHGHHLIMYNLNAQKRYKASLDNTENIMCLCSLCHDKIHHGTPTEIEKNVRKLLDKHSKLKDIYEIKGEEDIKLIISDYLINLKDERGEENE